MSEKDKFTNIENKKEDNQDDLDQLNNKRAAINEADNSRKQESRMMNFFNQEFVERKIDFKPKKILNDHKIVQDEIKSITPNTIIYEKLLELEKNIDEKMYKTRLDIQENLILPTPKIKALLRTHIFSSYCADPKAEDEMVVDGITSDHEWVLRIQGRIMPVLEEQPGGYYRKFSHFFNKIEIEFDPNNSNEYEKIEWNKTPNSDSDGFEIRRPAKIKDEIKLKFFFYLNYITPEYQLSNELANLLGVKQETRPKILYHIWQYIKINSLQDNDNPNIIINNRELQILFKCEKMDMTSLTARLVDHIKLPDPIIVDYTIKPTNVWTENQKLYDFMVNIDDPHFLDISNFLSNSDNESVLFPKSLFYLKNENQKNEKSQSATEIYYNKLQDYDRNISDLNEKLKKHKYKYDFYEAFEKDPINFINNFLIQQNSLLKIMQDEASIIDSRWDYNPAQYYKDNEDILKDYIDVYMNQK